MSVTRQLMDPIEFHSVEKKNHLLCSAGKKKSYRFGTNWECCKLWQNFHFSVNHPFILLQNI